MPVVSGHDAEEFHLVQLAPGRVTHDAVSVGAGDGVVHDIQTGVSVEDDVVRLHFHHIRHQVQRLRNAGEHAVVAAVGAVLAAQLCLAVQNVQQSHREIQLLRAWLSP